jgi:hypothetical protein
VVISYGLAIAFCLLGMFIAYMRTRYAIAFYLVIFGSLIVAAYKMGLVHEKPRILTRKSLGSVDAVIASPPNSDSSVIELPDPPAHDRPEIRSGLSLIESSGVADDQHNVPQ